MPGIGFVNPWLLLGLPLTGLPVVIHLLTRARPRPIRYPTLRFLREAGSGVQALHRLKLIVLLTIRCLAVAALVLMFAKPYLSAPGADARPGAERRVVLLVDSSMSMRASRQGVTLFARARAEAAEVLSALPSGSEAGVIFFSARAEPVLPALSRNTAELHKALTRATPTLELGRPAVALDLARRMLSGAGGSIYIFSDFQRTNWASVRLDDMGGASVLLRPVIESPVPNVAITSVSSSPAEPVAGESVEMACEVFNCAGRRRQESVSLLIEDEGVAMETSLSLKPFSSGTAVFNFILPRRGEFVGRVALRSDAGQAGRNDLVDDDTRHFSIRVRESLSVLVISDADAEDRSGAAFFMTMALCPSDRAGTGISVVRRHCQDTDQAVIARADVICIAPPASIPGRVSEAIAERINAGAHLICVLDGPTSPEILGAIASASGGSVSAPFRLGASLTARGGQPLGEADLAGDVLGLFGNDGQGDLSHLKFTRHFATEVLPGRKGEILIHHRDGAAALAMSPAGRGQAVFINFPMTMNSGNLVGRGIFPALLAEIMGALRRGGARPDAHPGEAWTLDLPAAGLPDETEYRVKSPGGDAVIPHSVVSRGRAVRISIDPVAETGVYRVESVGATTGPALWTGVAEGQAPSDVRPALTGVAEGQAPSNVRPALTGVVNVDPRESDTREVPLSYAVDSGDAAGGITVIDDEGRLGSAGTARSLWPMLAGAAALLLSAEMLLLALFRMFRRRPGSGQTAFGTTDEHR